MSSCAIPILIRRNPSAQCILQYIPYNRLEQTAPSLIAGRWNPENQQNRRNWMKNLNNFMNSCAIPNLFRRNSSADSIIKFIPYNRLEQTTPSWSAGQLNIQKSTKKRKWNEKPPQLHEFKSDQDDFWFLAKRLFPVIIHPIQWSWCDTSFLVVCDVLILSKCKNFKF